MLSYFSTGSGAAERAVAPGNSSAAGTIEPNRTLRCALWDAHERELQSAVNVQQTNRTSRNMVILALYESQDYLHIREDPLQWWKSNKSHSALKELLPVARKVLCIPATSCPSEHLFSKAGELISQKRNRLKGKKIDMLLFLNKNT